MFKAEVVITAKTIYYVEADTPEELEAAVAGEITRPENCSEETWQRGLRNEVYYDYNTTYDIHHGRFWKEEE